MTSLIQELGVKPFINLLGPVTRYGGMPMREEVIEVMREAATLSLDYYELQRLCGQRIAERTGNEACGFSCGAASGVQLLIGACRLGGNPDLADRLPCGSDLKTEVWMRFEDRGTEADCAVRNAGAVIRHFQEGELEEVLTPDAAAVLLLAQDVEKNPLMRKLIRTARDRGVPVIVDAACWIPPLKNFSAYTVEMGADALTVSGGKYLCGPQSSGLILGKKVLVELAQSLACPNDGLGRGMKVGKEEMLGLTRAVGLLLDQGDEAYEAGISDRLARLQQELQDLPLLTLSKIEGGVLWLEFDWGSLGFDGVQLGRHLMEGDPAVKVRDFPHTIGLDGRMLKESHLEPVIRALRETFPDGSN